MSFDYDKVSHKNGEHSWWTSYADLFMMLSIVFLLMYVASSLRNGSAGFQQQQEYKKLVQKAEDLEQQIKAYSALKEEALKKQASQSEQEVYQKLMDRLDLLKDEAHSEKEALVRKAKENEEKEFALNQYQQLIRNIINANVLAKSQISRRDLIIVSKNATIEEKKQKIAELEQVVSENQAQIDEINKELDAKIAELTAEQQRSASSKTELEHKISSLRQDSEQKILALQGKNQDITHQLTEVRGTLTQTTAQLAEAETQNASLAQKLEADRARYQNELGALERQHKAKLAAERAAFEKNLSRQRLSAALRAKKLKDYLAGERGKAAALEGRLTGLRQKIKDTEGQLAGAEADRGRALAEKGQALADRERALAERGRAMADKDAALAEKGQALAEKGQALAEKGRAIAAAQELKNDLEKTRAIANARKVLAKKIGDSFAAAGIKGNVDGRTGEVTLDFGDEYFDTGSTNLKPQMRTILDKFVPRYANSLFNDANVASKIGSVEIVGFASSTFKGRYVNPKSTRPGDKEALEYNLKLSFGRANSIFQHILGGATLSTADRERLMPMVKVVGRGYLPEGTAAADLPSEMSEADFCSRYNCKKAQRVVIKFNMKD